MNHFAMESTASRDELAEVLAVQIADEACRVDIECYALHVPSNYPAPVYDVTTLEPDHPNDEELCTADQEAIDRAVRYLDLRGLIVRPFSDSPQLVSFPPEAV